MVFVMVDPHLLGAGMRHNPIATLLGFLQHPRILVFAVEIQIELTGYYVIRMIDALGQFPVQFFTDVFQEIIV